MADHHESTGALIDEAGTLIDVVEYLFDLDTQRGLTGHIRSVNPHLPKLYTLKLRLDDRVHFVVVHLGMALFNLKRHTYDYRIYPASDQPDHPKNLLRQRPNRPPLGDV